MGDRWNEVEKNFKNFFRNSDRWEVIQDPKPDSCYSIYDAKYVLNPKDARYVSKRIPDCWLDSDKTVYFDFRIENSDDSDENQQKRDLIWGFFKKEDHCCIISMPHNCFVDYVKSDDIRNIEQEAIDVLLSTKKNYSLYS